MTAWRGNGPLRSMPVARRAGMTAVSSWLPGIRFFFGGIAMLRDYRDIAAGALLFIAGLIYAGYAAGRYELGTLRHMGPGMFPAALGVLLATFGILILLPALFRQGEQLAIRLLPPLFILAGVAAFALLIRPFGLIPAVLAVTIIASLAEREFHPVKAAALGAVLALIACLIFRVGLGLPIPLFRWVF